MLRIIRELLYCDPVGTGTNIRNAIEHLNRTGKRRSVVFLISDFFDQGFESVLKVAKRRHDIIPIVVSDPLEQRLPKVGLVRLRDSESGRTVSVDTSSRRNREKYQAIFLQKQNSRTQMFRKLQLEPLRLTTGTDIADPLRRYFHGREQR